ncbi:hypothetical protein M8R20_26350 [Pseudomonas sp. R2.Fl]|nr:hypothetical protein [Pseudomonas sp. R2.Fl]MCL6710465.1 hypothetical protein [Pseudomonas sp. R2.Fl]MCL6710525.1 hypothetical protein [Pseudomonas sp. R2.Fl]
MGWITFLKSVAASVPTPATDKVSLFVDDSTGVPAYKDDAGVVNTLEGPPGEGVPVGGTTGQVLAKLSGTDYDTGWSPAGAGVVVSIVEGAGVSVDDTDPANPIVAIKNGVNALGTSGAVTIDCALGDYFTCALSGNVTSISFSNLPGSGKGATKMVKFTQDSTPRTVAWPASFKWAGGTPGAVSTGSGAVDVLAMTTFDNGTTWDATLAKAFA